MGACNSILKDYKKEISFTHCPILEREKNQGCWKQRQIQPLAPCHAAGAAFPVVAGSP